MHPLKHFKSLDGSNIQSAAGTNYLTRHVAAHIAGQKKSYVGNVFCSAETPQGNACLVFVGSFPFFQVAGHISFYKTGGNGIAADIAAAQFFGHTLGEPNDAGLGGGIA